ncbi:MAG: transcriptional regulator [Comamonadaceae bacterium BICA1-1]|nr:MAG: transcriptional regulator [Comamonadaceae bacterium BICA1-1]
MQHEAHYLRSLVSELVALPAETGWVEFKHNKAVPDDIGEYISALANTAALQGRSKAYVVWGVEDDTHQLLGTTFAPLTEKVGNQELESWLLMHLEPRLNFSFHTVLVNDLPLVVLEVDAAFRHPVKFKGADWVRVGSYKKRLHEFPEMERALWRTLDQTPFEFQAAAEKLDAQDVLRLLDYPSYFRLLGLPLPDGHADLLQAMAADRLLERMDSGHWRVFNLGALLFAQRLADFGALGRKAVRLVRYKGDDRLQAEPEPLFLAGYAPVYEAVIAAIHQRLSGNEVIGKALRADVRMYPDLAIRELVANALIHQDLSISGAGPMVEMFSNRLEVTNPGAPLMDTQRLLDCPPRSRNEALASLMRRMHMCEERGTGVDKVVRSCELHQLPAPSFDKVEGSTRATLYALRPLTRMEAQDRIRAVYWHACLRHVCGQYTHNASIRERFGIADGNSSMASRLLKDAEAAKVIRVFDGQAAPKQRRYVPFWV